jgi:hypothetical protein
MIINCNLVAVTLIRASRAIKILDNEAINNTSVL